MRKLGFSVIGLILVAVIYYFTAGSAQITKEIKNQVNRELVTLEQNGFAIQNREIKESEEHFVIAFDDPRKIVAFFATQGAQMNIEDASALKGLRIGVDAKYLNDTYSALSLDIYPLNLPTSITELDMNKEDKLAIDQLNNILKKKALLVHVDFNKLLSSFKGHLKDIHETLQGEHEVKFNIEGVTFEGDIDKEKISRLDQKLKHITFEAKGEAQALFSELTSHYKRTGPNSYDSTSGYFVKNILLTGINGKSKVLVSIDNMSGDSVTSIKNNLAKSSIKATASKVQLEADGEKSLLEGIIFNFNIKNLDMLALKKLEKADVNNEADINRLLQELISKDISMKIQNLEIKKIEAEGKSMDGFALTANIDIDKSLNLAALKTNPMAALNAVNIKSKIVLSSELFSLVAKQPKAIILMMFIEPLKINGKKVYEVELKNGSLSVNGKPML